MAPLLLVIDPQTEGRQEFHTANRRVRVGRMPGLEISRPQDNLISNRHCVVVDGVLLDKGSTNGTLINDVAVEHGTHMQLKPGDCIKVGSTTIFVEATDATVPDAEKPHDAPARDMFLVYEGTKYYLPTQTIKIGRQATNDIVLQDALVSGSHCAIINGELLDERSTNGTFVNGEHVPYCVEVELNVGDRVQVGEATMTIVQATEDEVARWKAEGASGPLSAPLELADADPNATLAAPLENTQARRVAFQDETKEEPAEPQAAPPAEAEADATESSIGPGHSQMLGSMHDSKPAPEPQPSGGRGLLVAGVLVALAVGGYFVWQTLQEEQSSSSSGGKK